MRTTQKNRAASYKKRTTKLQKKAVVNPEMKDFSNDPYFLEKAERAKELLLKVGVPKNWE